MENCGGWLPWGSVAPVVRAAKALQLDKFTLASSLSPYKGTLHPWVRKLDILQ